jgi:hypothetical protein
VQAVPEVREGDAGPAHRRTEGRPARHDHHGRESLPLVSRDSLTRFLFLFSDPPVSPRISFSLYFLGYYYTQFCEIGYGESVIYWHHRSGSGSLIFISTFWAPNSTRLMARCHFTGPKKVSISRANPLPLAFVMDLHASKTLRTGPHKSLVHN